jgi:hypothetical protein
VVAFIFLIFLISYDVENNITCWNFVYFLNDTIVNNINIKNLKWLYCWKQCNLLNSFSKLCCFEKYKLYRSETEKTKPNQKKMSQTGLNWFFFLKNQTEPKPIGLNRFWFFFFKKFGLVIFFNKNQTEPKIIISIKQYNLLNCFSKLCCFEKYNLYIFL